MQQEASITRTSKNLSQLDTRNVNAACAQQKQRSVDRYRARRRKTPQKLRGAKHAVCKYYCHGWTKVLLSRTGVRGTCTTGTSSGRTWSEACSPAPPPSDKAGATPPVDAYAPLGAVVPVHRKHHRPPLGTRRGRSHCRPPTRRAPAHYAPHLRTVSQLQRAKSTTFDSLKRRGN